MKSFLHFYVNLRKDKNYVKKYFSLFKKILGKEEFQKLVKLSQEKKKDIETLKKEMEKIQKQWRKREKLFFKLTAEKFGEWKRKKYFCHVSSTYICGGGYEYPTIIIFPFSEHVNPLDTIVHELLHLHVIEDVKRLRLNPKDWITFSEIAVAFMTGKIKNEFDLPILFPNKYIEKKFYLIEKKLQKKMNPDDFLKFLEKFK